MKSTSALPFVIALIIVVAGIYWYIFTGTGNQAPLSANGSVNQAQTTFQALVNELQPISFDTSLFSDPRFNALVDFTVSVSPEVAGRPDPFAPLAGGNGNK